MSCVHPTQPYPLLPSIPFPSDIARETLNSERPRTRLTHFRIAHSIRRTVSTVPGYDSRSSLRREYPPLLSILYSVRYSFFALFRTHTPLSITISLPSSLLPSLSRTEPRLRKRHLPSRLQEFSLLRRFFSMHGRTLGVRTTSRMLVVRFV